MIGLLAAIPGLSQRFACVCLDWCRGTMRRTPKVRARDERMKRLLPWLAQQAPREGSRRMWKTVVALCEPIGKEAVHRLWKLLKLQVKPRQRHRKRTKPLPEKLGLRATGPNHVWCMDFMQDWTLGGAQLRILSVVDEYTRECLALIAAARWTAVEVVALLEWLGHQHGLPVHVRSDNGPEFVATVVPEWARTAGVELIRSAPGCPWHNAYAESFHSRARDEFTEGIVFGSLAEAEVLCEAFRRWYNEGRRHSALKYETPAAFAARVRTKEPVLGGLRLAEAAA